ncbi:MAG: septum formation protein Maf [Desulfuromonas sp.]|uniref:Maf family protein n=1 Tax=Desulfuromonas sp. TaxID=892 RepID=UPI000CC007F7|nr:Maf family protein [Desulfuromonas sp.]PLX86010.1 MAG: septum formation protein Maf [Desulfuromonas sp.]
MRTLVLASTSPYRLQLLRQLGLQFHVDAPLFKEEIDQEVAPELQVKHLAHHKAKSLRERYPDALILGADQVFVDARGHVLGKPGTAEGAFRQLREMAGRSHVFYTGVSLFDSASGDSVTDVATYTVTLRSLSDDQIRTYLERENPLDCAGSFKIEGLGIALMKRMAGDDYTALIGLPLTKVIDLLGRFGVEVL